MNQTEKLNLISDVIKKLAGNNACTWFEAVNAAINKKEYWKDINVIPNKISVGKLTEKTLIHRLNSIKCEILYYAKKLMEHEDFYITKSRSKVKFAIVPTATFMRKEDNKNGYPIEELIEKIRRSPKYGLCEPSDAFFVRLDYHNQSLAQTLLTAMDPITISKTGNPGGVFCLKTSEDNTETIDSYQHYPHLSLYNHVPWLVRVK